MYEKQKKLNKLKTQNKIKSIRNPFIITKKQRKKKEIKDRIVRDIWTLFEQQEKQDYFKFIRVISEIMTILNMKVMVTK